MLYMGRGARCHLATTSCLGATNQGDVPMSLFATPVSQTDLTTLQAGVQFFTNPTQAASQMTAINAPGSTQSVFTYAASLINSNISFSQVAMAVGAIAEG